MRLDGLLFLLYTGIIERGEYESEIIQYEIF